MITLEKHQSNKDPVPLYAPLILKFWMITTYLSMRTPTINFLLIFCRTRQSLNSTASYKLKAWLMNETAAQGFLRESYALACFYIDFYFQKGNKLEISQYQIFGISCFIIAAKIVESRVPRISYKTFDKKDIIKMENLICYSLEYKLNPLTYIQIANQTINLWDQFNKTNGFYKTLYYANSKQSYFFEREFYERLDSMNMVLRFHDYDLRKLILNAFFVQNKINCLELSSITAYSSQEISSIFYNRKDSYYQCFLQFMRFMNCDDLEILIPQIGYFYSQFLELKIDQEVVVNTRYGTQIQYWQRQTLNRRCHIQAKKFIAKNKKD